MWPKATHANVPQDDYAIKHEICLKITKAYCAFLSRYFTKVVIQKTLQKYGWAAMYKEKEKTVNRIMPKFLNGNGL